MICSSCKEPFANHPGIQPICQKLHTCLDLLLEIQREEERTKGKMAWMSRTWQLAEKAIKSCTPTKTPIGASLESK